MKHGGNNRRAGLPTHHTIKVMPCVASVKSGVLPPQSLNPQNPIRNAPPDQIVPVKFAGISIETSVPRPGLLTTVNCAWLP